MMGLEDVDDEEDDAGSEPEEEQKARSSLRSPSTKRPAPQDGASSSSSGRSAAASATKPKRPPSLMLRMNKYTSKEKYTMLSRMARGLAPTDDSEDAEFALSAPAAAASTSASASSSSALDLTGVDPWEMEDPAAVALWHAGLPHNPRSMHMGNYDQQRVREAAQRLAGAGGSNGNGASDSDGETMEDMESGGRGATAGVAGAALPLPEDIPVGYEVDALRKPHNQPGRWEPATVVAALPGFDSKLKLHFDNDGDDADQVRRTADRESTSSDATHKEPALMCVCCSLCVV